MKWRGRHYYRWRVPAAFAVGLATLALARPTRLSLVLGVACMVPGEALRLWAAGHIDKTRCLATSGPYRHSRNPLYLGSVLICLGVAVAAAQPVALLAIAAYLLAFFPYVIRSERCFLRERFGSQYEAWASRVPEFVPRLTPAGPPGERFAWRRVSLNREWKALLAPPVALALLYARSLLLP